MSIEVCLVGHELLIILKAGDLTSSHPSNTQFKRARLLAVIKKNKRRQLKERVVWQGIKSEYSVSADDSKENEERMTCLLSYDSSETEADNTAKHSYASKGVRPCTRAFRFAEDSIFSRCSAVDFPIIAYNKALIHPAKASLSRKSVQEDEGFLERVSHAAYHFTGQSARPLEKTSLALLSSLTSSNSTEMGSTCTLPFSTQIAGSDHVGSLNVDFLSSIVLAYFFFVVFNGM
ncbi:hypothetical protein GOBAR_DD00976 [Gossypium barbadense]|nr:hypothetical protein GOBAR_DD00976 [Gossypium barbadense]